MTKINSKKRTIDDIFWDYNDKYTALIDVFSPLNIHEKRDIIKEYQRVYEILEDYYLREEVNRNTDKKGDLKWGVFNVKLNNLTNEYNAVFKD